MSDSANLRIESLFSVRDKVVLVTGGSRGIGEMIAQGFVANGCKVYISSRSSDTCAKVAKKLTEQGPGSCFSIPADLSRPSEIQRLLEEFQKREPALHVLVNNAGANWAAKLDEYSDQAMEKVLQLNLKSIFTLTRGLLPLLRKSGRAEDPARIINIGSINGIQPPGFPTFAYSASKAALHMLTKHMAAHCGKDHITVNAVAPGSFQSRMMAATLRDFGEVIKMSVPLGRIGVPSDMAGVCIWLASRAGAYVNGAVVAVDGGALVSSPLANL